ncbi:hypothetical protein BPOR_0228g00120 [Botrytis porri]|uniref:BZIP domain-containing protein n=1 Tax=Botrytis porri TaxID=87229 RepID=A0A4Z1KPF8_9HELO|nr:hypothetical protein BPOR_0228g00120 [Botrytis porri]
MADESQDASFTSFWHRSVDKISSQKVKFMPNITRLKTFYFSLLPMFTSNLEAARFTWEIARSMKLHTQHELFKKNYLITIISTKLTEMTAKDENSEIKSGTSQKQHRRAQVRRAQIEHRQRKQNYVKHLEEDAIRLRGMIATTKDESSALVKENKAIESTLLASGIKNLSSLKSQDPGSPAIKPINMPLQQGYDSLRGLTTPDSTQGTKPTIRTVDYESENSRLSCYISDVLTQDSDPLTNYFSDNHDVPYPKTPLPFDPAGDPSGHELMASTHIFAQAPPKAFSGSTSDISWSSSSVSLAQLYAMSQSLPVSDFEITPVQAWFMIAEKYHNDIDKVVGPRNMNSLKRGLGGLSRCYQFGAVMDVGSFWEVVDDVMRQNGS